jgi:CheY-like chemotaxis protein
MLPLSPPGSKEDKEMKTLLVVEDDRNQVELYKQELEDEGYVVVTALDGREAIEKMGKHQVDLIILDINMPKMDGIEALGRILGKNNTMPVIIHTAYAHYKDNFMTWSAEYYITKSSDLDELKEKIREVLSVRERKNQ